MKTLILVAAALSLSANAWALPKYGPNAVPLSNDPNLSYFQHQRAPDFWALISYYLPQQSDTGCSAANFTMVLNASRDVEGMSSQQKLVTISSLLETLSKGPQARYAAAMNGKLGALDRGVVATPNLAKVLEEAIRELGLQAPGTRVELVKVDEKNREASRKEFHRALVSNEKSSNDFLIINFEQGDLTGDPEGGAHVATVGAYDAKSRRVLILDPDREWYGPYWSPESRVFEAIADPRSDSQAPGWIHVRFR